jgi:hypothetical protein
MLKSPHSLTIAGYPYPSVLALLLDEEYILDNDDLLSISTKHSE